VPIETTYNYVILTWLILAFITFVVLLRIKAPYGRYASKSWGPTVHSGLGWVVMELPAALVFAFFFVTGSAEKTIVTWTFFVLWEAHYINRSLIYPSRAWTRGKRLPVLIVVMAIIFNVGNGFANGHFLGSIAPVYQTTWLTDPRFLIGTVLFVSGAAVNLKSDSILLRLKNSEKSGYQIPRGGLFKYVSCPNYLGEIIEWTGFALAAWSPTALVFAIWTAANLVPRALSHHSWYRTTFADYPSDRKALIPGLL